MSTYHVEITELLEMKLIGIPVSATFQNQINEISKVKEIFMNRRTEIASAISSNKYICPHFANDILFTYIYCLEVSRLEEIPDGMIGFAVPKSRYVKVKSQSTDIEPYGIANEYIKKNKLAQNAALLMFEVHSFGGIESKYQAEILIPIQD